MKCADQILACGDVDRRLAADRAVDLGKQAGRYLHEPAAAIEDGGSETGEVADHTSTEGDNMVAAFDAEGKQAIDQPGQAGPAFARLAGPMEDRHRFDRTKPPHQPWPLSRPDSLVADDDQPVVAGQRCEMRAGLVEKSVLDDYSVAPAA